MCKGTSMASVARWWAAKGGKEAPVWYPGMGITCSAGPYKFQFHIALHYHDIL